MYRDPKAILAGPSTLSVASPAHYGGYPWA
jgi:hypothetical protein